MDIISLGIIVTAVVSIVLVLLQDRSSGTGSAFGGSVGGAYQQRRGVERVLFLLTIAFVVLFAAFSVFNLMRIATQPEKAPVQDGASTQEAAPTIENVQVETSSGSESLDVQVVPPTE